MRRRLILAFVVLIAAACGELTASSTPDEISDLAAARRAAEETAAANTTVDRTRETEAPADTLSPAAAVPLAADTPVSGSPPAFLPAIVASATAGTTLELPPPKLTGDVSLEEALSSRRSVRQFDDQPLTLVELGQLLWATQGITDEAGRRTAPSAGALYPLELLLATAEGVFYYEPVGHELLVVSTEDARTQLYEAALRQESVLQAPAVLVVAAVYERTAERYGEERSPRYVHLEAGHATQNLLLQAVALDLGAVPVGAFDDDDVQAALGLPADHRPLYLVPVGYARVDSP